MASKMGHFLYEMSISHSSGNFLYSTPMENYIFFLEMEPCVKFLLSHAFSFIIFNNCLQKDDNKMIFICQTHFKLL